MQTMQSYPGDSRMNECPIRVCRACLQHNVELFPIFHEAYAVNGVTVAQMLNECTRYRAEPDNCILPHEMCAQCIRNARTAFDFKRQVEDSYRTLTGHIESSLEMKVKPFNDDETTSKKKCVEIATQTDKVCLHPCELCEMKFFDLLELRQHRKLVHHSSSNQCRICGLRFERMRQLRSHLVQKHPSVGIALDTQCTICPRRFSRREHLNRHMQNIHNQRKEPSSVKSSLKEPEIELTRNDLKIRLRKIPKKEKEDKISVKRSLLEPEIDLKLEDKSEFLKTEDIIDTSHFLECVQAENTDFEDDNNMDINPILSDSENNTGLDMPDDILPQLKLEKEPIIKVEQNSDHNTRDFDMNSSASSTNWETSDTNNLFNLTQEHDTVIAWSSDVVASPVKRARRTRKNSPERRRIMEAVDEYLAQNRQSDESANAENRCTKCQRTFSRHCHLRRHMLTHVEEKAHACTFCPKRFARSDHLKKHVINLHHTKEFKCDQCNCAFARSVELTKHQEMRHGDDPQANKVHDCEYCGKKFTSKTYLRKHILLHTDRVFACKYCEETFKERKLLREHEKGHHSNRRNFLCSVCGESFVRNDYLRVHMRRHNGEKPYKCQYCGKGFPRTTDVKIHERYHTGTKPNLCTLCGKGFHRAYNLTIHMRTHTGERPFKCDECGRGFAQSNDLKSHIRRHTGERFKCAVCDAGFLQMYALRQHSLNAHGIQMEPSTGRLQKFAPATTAVHAPLLPQALPPSGLLSVNAQLPLNTQILAHAELSSQLQTANQLEPTVHLAPGVQQPPQQIMPLLKQDVASEVLITPPPGAI